MLDLKNEEKYLALEKKNKRILDRIGLLRIIMFVIMIIFFICYLSLNYNYIFLILAALGLVGLILVAVLSRKYYYLEKLYKLILLSFKRHEARRVGKTYNNQGFFDKGLEFKRKYSKKSKRIKYLVEDIDLFGDRSLYQSITNAHSILGREELANSLVEGNKYYEKRVANGFREKINRLGEDERMINLEASLALNETKMDMEYKDYLNILGSNFTLKKNKIYGLILVYLLDLIIILLPIFNVLPFYSYIFIPIINLYYSTYFKDDLNKINSIAISNSLAGYRLTLKSLTDVDYTFIDPKYTKEYFLGLRNDLNKANHFWSIMSYKNNPIFMFIFNALFCFEGIFQAISIKYNVNIEKLDNVFKTISDLENLTSFANVKADYNSCIPVEGEKLSFVNLANPLVKDCIANSFTYNKGVILTGSNMAGKTTFLRTIATNTILFMAGSVVLADSYTSPRYELYTSLRIKDELSEGVSTFYAEIEKIREMIEDTSTARKLCLIDEIFKGTNTLDRIYGATKLIEKLAELDYDHLVSTHDFELCDLPNIENYHFSELYDEDYTHISFDYTLKKGKSNSTNAIFLLKASGLIK